MTYRQIQLAIAQCRALALEQAKELTQGAAPHLQAGRAAEILARPAHLDRHLQRAEEFCSALATEQKP